MNKMEYNGYTSKLQFCCHDYNGYTIGFLNDKPTHSLIGSSMIQGHSQTLIHVGPLV